MDAGKSFSRFTHYKFTQPEDELGSAIPTYTKGKTYWANFQPLRPTEALAYEIRTEQLGVKIVFRGNPPIKAGDGLRDQRDGTQYLVVGPAMWSKTELAVMATSGIFPGDD